MTTSNPSGDAGDTVPDVTDGGTTPAKSVIVVEDLYKRLGSRTVLDGVSFSVAAGEAFGLVGPNGAGKTTLSRVLATLVAPDEGHVTISGHRVEGDLKAVRRCIGYLPEAFGVYPRITCEEYLEFYAGVHGVPTAARGQLVGELLEVVGLSERRGDDVEALSRGELQRLGLGRTLVHDPEVLVLEEPTAGLDPKGQVEVRELLGELRGMGKTIFVSTNRVDDLEGVITYLGVLDGGRMVDTGAATADRSGRIPSREAPAAPALDVPR